MTAELSISAVARQAGVRPSAIRYYESIGVLPTPNRVSGQRRYDAGVFKRLAIVDVARRAGLSLEEARTLLDGFSPKTPPGARWQALAQRKLPEIEVLIQRATEMKRLLEIGTQCRCVSFDECDLGEFARVKPRAASRSAVGPEQQSLGFVSVDPVRGVSA